MGWCFEGHQQAGTYITHICSKSISIKHNLLIPQWVQHKYNQF